MSKFIKVTEQSSHYNNLEKMSLSEMLVHINYEDSLVPSVVSKAIPQIEKLIIAITQKLTNGGRLFYIGAGTSGRLGILDASEIPPTYGLPYGIIVGIIAGGNEAITNAVENAEDSADDGWNDLVKFNVSENDVVIGIAASGTTPYVLGALEGCKKNNIITGCITCNPNAPIVEVSDFPIEVVVGPEFVTGSTRMKSGTAQKLVLNMISTALMISIGKVEDNKMVNMQLSNDKLVDRGTLMLMEKLQIKNYDDAKSLLLSKGGVKKALE